MSVYDKVYNELTQRMELNIDNGTHDMLLKRTLKINKWIWHQKMLYEETTNVEYDVLKAFADTLIANGIDTVFLQWKEARQNNDIWYTPFVNNEMMKSLTSQLQEERRNNDNEFLKTYGFELPLVKEIAPRVLWK